MEREQFDANEALEEMVTEKMTTLNESTNGQLESLEKGQNNNKKKRTKKNQRSQKANSHKARKINNDENGRYIDIGIGSIRLPEEDKKIITNRNLVGNLTYADLIGDPSNNSLKGRNTEFGLIGVLGAAREGKTALSRAISRLHDIPYYSILEPFEGQPTVNQPSVTLEDAVKDIESAFENTDCDIIVIDSSRFINSVRTYGLAPGGTPTAYNIILTMLHNAAVLYGKLIILVISTMTNEPDHISLMRSMVIGSSLGLIEPSLLSGGGRISVRGGDRDFIDFTMNEEEFMKLCNIKSQPVRVNRETTELSVVTNPTAVLENQETLNETNLQIINDFQEFIVNNK